MPLLTTNFSVNELSATNYPYFNTPGPVAELYLLRLAEMVLEPWRTLLGASLICSSGYRSAAVNNAAGGARDSAHLEGRAADIIPATGSVEAAFRILIQSGIPFDQAIWERLSGKEWVHVAVPKIYNRPRRQALVKTDGINYATYSITNGEGTA